ncbi:diguanylate cyclase [Acidobacteria bacterium AH-259-D05]|nr:diguanylate cyclase [Acidobacteria bacterium AH-259-D05]
MNFFEQNMSYGARIYILVVIVVGAIILGFSLYDSLTSADFTWLYLACLTVFGTFFPVRISSFPGKTQPLIITTSDVFIFTAILLFGPEVAVTVGAIDGAITKTSKRAYKVFFNVTQLSLVTFIVGHIFYQLHGTFPPLDPAEVDDPSFLVALGLSAILYFVLNSVAVGTAIILTSKPQIFAAWKKDFLWVSFTTFAGASAAALIVLYFDEAPLFAIVLALPIILIIYYAYKMNSERIKQTNQHLDQLNNLYHSTIESLAMAIDAKDAKTHGHIQRVQTLSLGLARHCGITDENQLEGLRAASLLHDIGKLAISEYILNKPSPLTKWEKQKMRKHPTIGADILSSVPFPYPVGPYVRHHHEKWDGTGYPDGLKGEAIPLGARILAVADCYDALRSDRPYRPQLSPQVSLEHIMSESGKSYDPAIVKQLAENIDELEAAMKETESYVSKLALPGEQDFSSDLKRGQQERLRTTVFHEIASTHKEIQALYEISRVLGKSLKVSETLSLLAEKIQKLVPYSSCAIYLLDSQNGKLVPYHTAGMHADLLQNIELAVGDGITGWVTAHKQYLINVSPAPDFMDSEILSTAYRSCLVMPLSLNDAIVGVISLYSDQPEDYNQDHLRFMETIADHAATAIRNAIVYEESQEHAYTDLLTGLPNLRFFNVFIERELKNCTRMGQPLTLLMMDLEKFKEVNDQFGHKIGNRILIEIAHFLRDQLRESDTCIRYAGDEFIAVLPRVGKEQASHAIRRIQNSLDNYQMMIDEHNSVLVGISIGAAGFPEDGRQPDLLLAVADQAMYKDKFERRKRKEYPAEVIRFDRGADKSS